MSSPPLAREEDDTTGLVALARLLRENIDIKDRRYRIRLYPKCFLGSEAVAWLVASGHAGGVNQATKLGNRMIRAGLFHHVHHEHLLEDAKLFYRFVMDENRVASNDSSTEHSASSAIQGCDDEKETRYVDKSLSSPSNLKNKIALAKLDAGQNRDDFHTKAETNSHKAGPSSIAREKDNCNSSFQKLPPRFDHEDFKDEEAYVKFLTSRVNSLQLENASQKTKLISVRKVSYSLFVLLIVVAATKLSLWAVLILLALLYWLLSEDVKNTLVESKMDFYEPSGSKVKNDAPAAVAHASKSWSSKSKSSDMTLPPPANSWPLGSLLIRSHSTLTSQPFDEPLEPSANTFHSIAINSANFEGRIIILLRNAPCPGGPADKTRLDNYFKGRRRISVNYVQGHFKNRTPIDQVFTGQTFERPLVNMPGHTILRVAFGFLRGLAPNLHADISGITPYLLTPLISAAQTVHIALTRESAPSLEHAAERLVSDADMENTKLLFEDGDEHAKVSLSSSKRRKFFKRKASLTGKYFNPEHTYTFGFWQDLFDPVDYGAHLPFGTFEVASYLDGQPLQIQAQIGTEYTPASELWRFDLWNTKLIPGLAKAQSEMRV